MSEQREVWLVTPEFYPLMLAGGLGNFSWGLARALHKRGWKVRIALPAYGSIKTTKRDLVEGNLLIPLGFGKSKLGRIYRKRVPLEGKGGDKLEVYLFDVHPHFSAIGSSGGVYRWPDFTPWIDFSTAVARAIWQRGGEVQLAHCQDAHCSLVPVFFKLWGKGERGERPRALLTVHNLLEQGVSPPQLLDYAGFPREWFTLSFFEFYGKANPFKAGLLAADLVSTVSPSYAEEIASSPEFGFGLEGVFADLKGRGKLRGILNGIDYQQWRLDFLRYDGSEADLHRLLEYKGELRKKWFSRWGWELGQKQEPLFAFRARWDRQKGIFPLMEVLPEILEVGRVVLVSWGFDGQSSVGGLWQRIRQLAERYPQRLRLNPEELSSPEGTAEHYALSDFLLQPSVYEPCGLTQMECQRFGTLPIVHRVGGLRDTVSEEERSEFPSPNGLTFSPLNGEALLDAIYRAVELFGVGERYRLFLSNALRQSNSWEERVGEYEELYRQLLDRG